MDVGGSKSVYPSQTGRGGGTGPGVFTTLHVTGTSALDGAVTMGGDLLTGPVAVNIGGGGIPSTLKVWGATVLAAAVTLSTLSWSTLHVNGTGVVGGVADVAAGSVLASNGVAAAPTYTNSPSLTNLTLSGTLRTSAINSLVADSGILVTSTQAGVGTYAFKVDVSASDVTSRQAWFVIGTGGTFDISGDVTSRLRLTNTYIDGVYAQFTGKVLADHFEAKYGDTIPATGAFRMSKSASQVGIVGRNNADGADRTWLIADTSDNLTLGNTSMARTKLVATTAVQIAMATPVIELGTATVSTVGQIRTGNNSTIIGALTAGGLDIYVAGTNASNDVLLGGTVNTSRTVIRGSVATQLTTGVLEMTGATVSSTGEIRSPAATARVLWGCLKNGGEADLTVIAVDASNNITFGDVTSTARVKFAPLTAVQIAMTTPVLELGTAAVAASGTLRSVQVTARTAWAVLSSTSTDLAVLAFDATNNLYVGGTAAAANLFTRAVVMGSTAVQIGMASPALEIGNTNLATVGEIRSMTVNGNADRWCWRNALASADFAIISTDSSNNLYLGRSIGATATSPVGTIVNAGTSVTLSVANTGAVVCNSTTVTLQPAGTARITCVAATVTINPTTTVDLQVNGTSRITITTASITCALALVTTGSNPSSSGDIRMARGTARDLIGGNAQSGSNQTILAANASDGYFLGQTAAGGAQAATFVMNGSTSVTLNANATAKATFGVATTTLNNTTTDIQSGGTSRIKTDGTGVGFWNNAPIAQPSIATITNSVTAGGTTDVIDNIVAAAVDTSAADLVTTRNAMYQVARKLKQVVDALRTGASGYGLFQ